MDIKEFIIDENYTMIGAMAQLDKIEKKVLFVTKEEKLIASITDGDIRRWILKKGNLDACVKDIANYKPRFIKRDKKFKAKEIMSSQSIEAIPVVDDNKHIISISFKDDEVTKKKDFQLPIVIMAGGFGTRLYPYTKILPKPLIPIGEKPIVEHIINRFHVYGNDEFHLIVNHKKNMIKAYFTEVEKKYEINYADEEEPLGTGGGLSLLKGKIDSTFFLTNCDILIEEDYQKMYEYHKKEGNLITMITSLKNIKIPYGVIEINGNGKIKEMKEKPEFSFFTNTGMYIIEPKVINELEENQAIDFPDILEQYKDKGEKIGVYPISENAWMDMGQLDELEKMRDRLENE